MFSYYLDLALRSLRRHKAVTALMIVAIGLGIGASMTMLTLLHVMSADPLPGASSTLFYPQLEPRSHEQTDGDTKMLGQLTWADAMNLLHARRGSMQAAMSSGRVAVTPPGGNARAFFADARYTSADFFPMFRTPFLHGQGWTHDDDDRRSHVVVISRALATRLFGVDEAVGKTLRLGTASFQVIGVLDHWQPVPLFYDLTMGGYAKAEEVFMPMETAVDTHMPLTGSITCWGTAGLDRGGLTHADQCAWTEFWVKLDTPAQVNAYRTFLDHYAKEQHALGRFPAVSRIQLTDLKRWLDTNHVVPGSVELQALLAFGFLIVCLVNTVALLLVKFSRRMGELSVRRAMGAAKRAIFAQLLIEAATIGVSGGMLGLMLASVGLWVVRQQPNDYAAYARMDGSMLLLAIVLSITASLAAAIFPAWRTCRVAPALALKVQ
jgi:putative ABC transport system permease protein